MVLVADPNQPQYSCWSWRGTVRDSSNPRQFYSWRTWYSPIAHPLYSLWKLRINKASLKGSVEIWGTILIVTSILLALRGVIWWRDDCDIAIWDKTVFGFSLHCYFRHFHYKFAISFIHAPTDLKDRVPMWNRLLNMTDISDLPWIIMGDLNVIWASWEKSAGKEVSFEKLGNSKISKLYLTLGKLNLRATFLLGTIKDLMGFMLKRDWTECLLI